MPKDINLDRRLTKSPREPDEEAKQLDIMLAYGSTNLGLNSVPKESSAEKRVKEDLKK